MSTASRRSFLRTSAALPLVGLPALAAADLVVMPPDVPLPAAPPAVDRQVMYLVGKVYRDNDDITPPFLDGLTSSKKKARQIRKEHCLFESPSRRGFIRKLTASFPKGSHYVNGYYTWRPRSWKPEHFLDIPVEDTASSHDRGESWNLLSRKDAIARAAEENAEQINKYRAGDTRESGWLDWSVVLQIGRPFQSGYWSIHMEGDEGLQEAEIIRPVRLGRPTAEEVARYAPEPLVFEEAADSIA